MGGKKRANVGIRFLTSVPWPAHIFAFVIMVCWLVKALYLDEIPAVNLHIYELGKVVEGLINAIIAGYVFYLFFAMLPSFSDRLKLKDYIDNRIEMVCADGAALLGAIGKYVGYALPFMTVSVVELETAMRSINPDSQPPLSAIGPGRPWLALMYWRRERSLKHIGEALRQGPFIDAEIIALLVKIESSTYLESQGTVGVDNPCNDLGWYSKSFFNYLENLRLLAIEIERQRVKSDSFIDYLTESSTGDLPPRVAP